MNEEQDYVSYLRPDLEEMSGYQPGEQLNIPDIVKLNTNESPYPPSPLVMETLSRLDYHRLRLYPNPTSDPVREELERVLCVPPQNIICGNGSDDILNIIIRSFTSPSLPMACLHPSYSLYPTLAKLNQTPCKMIELTDNFDLPEDLLEQAKGANLLILTCPNAPTGNSFVMEKVEHICANFKGIVLIDEAYCDFAWFNCLFLFPKYKNVILSRTFSKSRALAGLRFGYAIAHENVINGLMKMKDSYNVSYLTQMLAIASLRDTEYFVECVDKIRYDREILKDGLTKRGFHVIESSTNFLFAMPPDHNGERCFSELKKRKILVRYFPGERTGDRVRISVGTNENVQKVLAAVSEIYGV